MKKTIIFLSFIFGLVVLLNLSQFVIDFATYRFLARFSFIGISLIWILTAVSFMFLIRSARLAQIRVNIDSKKTIINRIMVPVFCILILMASWFFLFKIRSVEYQRQQSAIEYHAALDIYNMSSVQESMKKYPKHESWVRPLRYTFIEDREYLARILPDYTDVNIHCIIVAHSPEGTRFFLEDGDLHHNYIEVPEVEFLESLYSAPQEDYTAFWLNLRP